jgi:type I restriction enzyme S subunit
LKRDVEKNVKIGNLFNPITEKGFSMLPILSVTINGKIVRRNSLDRNISDETGEEKYIRVLPGDLAYNTMRLWQGAIGLVEEEGLCSGPIKLDTPPRGRIRNQNRGPQWQRDGNLQLRTKQSTCWK